MNKQLNDAIARLSELPEERQEAIGTMLLGLLDDEGGEIEFTAEQLAEIKAALSDDEPYASPEQVETFFAKFNA